MKHCDLVMRGGLTSGIVYPKAIVRHLTSLSPALHTLILADVNWLVGYGRTLVRGLSPSTI